MAASKSLNRRALLQAGLAIGAGGAAAAALGGCGEAQIVEVEKVVTQVVEKVVTKVVQAEPMQKKAVTITLWAEPHTLVDPIFAEHVPLYNKLHPHVTVNHVIIPWSDIPVKTLTSMAAGDHPDIAYNHPQLNANFAAKGVIDPIDPYIASDKTFEFDDYLEGPIAEFRWKGKVWALPLYNGPLLYVYNRDLMEQVGMGDPWELFQEGNWTIEIYEKIGEAAIALGGSGQDRIFADREVPKARKNLVPLELGHGRQDLELRPHVGRRRPNRDAHARARRS
ncbi:MAG: extracellular solute-binding protein [Chloroflexi bacterium]|nr:extracellular solute-binding protein [Chloroflexota bacterium]MCY3938434.1 extracellular solute-binding protein [Chloroflexota bacterium]